MAALVQAACPLVEPSAGHNASDVAEGRMARAFFYRVLIIQARDRCIGQDHVMAALSELLRSARMRDAGLVDEKAYLDKEREVTGLLRAEDERRRQGGAAHDDANLMQRYAAEIQERLFKLPVPRQFSMCTYFGDRPVCEQ